MEGLLFLVVLTSYQPTSEPEAAPSGEKGLQVENVALYLQLPEAKSTTLYHSVLLGTPNSFELKPTLGEKKATHNRQGSLKSHWRTMGAWDQSKHKHQCLKGSSYPIRGEGILLIPPFFPSTQLRWIEKNLERGFTASRKTQTSSPSLSSTLTTLFLRHLFDLC